MPNLSQRSHVSKAFLKSLIQSTRKQASGDDPLEQLFERQLGVIRDPAKFKTLLCGSRAGKTSVALRQFVDTMQREPGSKQLYTAQTRTTAKNILWEPLRELNIRHGWGLVLNEAELRARHPNGSWLLLAGMDTRPELEKARGIPWTRVVIDECGSHRPSYLQYYAEEVIEPRLMDRNGELWLAGTPTIQAFGFFFDATTGGIPGYSKHHWTAADNPHMPFDRYVDEMLARRGWTRDNPIFRREIMAEWVIESERSVYRFAPSRNVVAELPALEHGDEWIYVLGIDFGVGHKTAAAVLAYPRRYGRDAYVVKTWSKAGLAPSDANGYIYEHFIKSFSPRVTVGDVGGMGKAYQSEWNKRLPGVPLKAADKRQKRAALEFTSDALHVTVGPPKRAHERRGLMSLRGNDELHRQWATLQWDEERGDIADGQDDDISHAVLYAFRECPAFSNAKMPEPRKTPLGDTTADFERPVTVPSHLRNLAKNWGNPR